MSFDNLNPQTPEESTNELDSILETGAATDTAEKENKASGVNAFEETHAHVFADKQPKVSGLTLSLIVASIVAIILGSVVLGILLLGDPGESADIPSDDESETDVTDDLYTEDTDAIAPEKGTSITLLDKKANEKNILKKIDFKNKDESFTIYYNDKDGNFLLKGYEDIKLSSDLISLLKDHSSTLVALDQIKEVGDLKDYGLDKPAFTATITYTDNSTTTIHLGDELPTGDGYYGTSDAKKGVYMFHTDTVMVFRLQSVAFADTLLVESPIVRLDDTNGNALLKELRYTGKNHAYPLTIRRSYSNDREELQLFTYLVSEPYLHGVTDDAANYFGNFKSLSASHALYLHPTAQQKKKLGFDKPLTKLEFTMAVETSYSNEEDAPNSYYNEQTTTVTIGSVDSDGNYIAMVDGVDAIFLVEKSLFSTIAERTYSNTVNPLLFLKNIDQISRISVKIDGKTHDFEMQHYPTAELQDEQLKVVCNGRTMSTPDFRELYLLLLGLNRYDYLEKLPDTAPEMSIKIYDLDGDLYMGATYYNMSGTFCAVETTEGETFTTRWKEISHFMNQVVNLLNGDKVHNLIY